ncbi:hypothetical protein Tco_0534314 [Tanacetum coccineum]
MSFVGKIVHDSNKAPDSPPHPHTISSNQRHCFHCKDVLGDGKFCQRCTCKSCGNGAHYGYNCPPKVPIISNPEPCNNQTVDELPQTLPSFDPTCYSGDGSSFTYDSTPNFVDDSPNVFNPPPEPPTYSYDALVIQASTPTIQRYQRRYMPRDRYGAHDRLVLAYFAKKLFYNAYLFRKRFRMNRSLFTRIVQDLSANCPYFQEGCDAVGKAGISALVKCTSAMDLERLL